MDIFEGDLAGLISAEVEFKDIDSAQEFEAPDWFSVDITEEKGFKNQSLATRGLSKN